jgi:hypothetical protein
MGQDLVRWNWHRIDGPGFGEAELAHTVIGLYSSGDGLRGQRIGGGGGGQA